MDHIKRKKERNFIDDIFSQFFMNHYYSKLVDKKENGSRKTKITF
jgi:hypothetical protein